MSNEVATREQAETAVARQDRKPAREVAIDRRGIIISDLDDLWKFASFVAKSGMAPKGMESPESILVAIQMGLEVGLTPMAAIQNIAVINGRPSLWGDSQLAVVRGCGQLEHFSEWYEHKGNKLERNPTEFDDSTSAVCRVQRQGDSDATVTSFSVGDAKKAQLWGKSGPWSQYPARMLRFRARSFALRDKFGDALKGLLTDDEAHNLPPAEVTVAQPIFGVARFEPVTQPDPAPPKEPRKKKAAAPQPEPTKQPEPTSGNQDAPTATGNWLHDFCANNKVSWDDCQSFMVNQGFLLQAETKKQPQEVLIPYSDKLKANAGAQQRIIDLYAGGPE